ncbi:MAG: GTPase, partial [candidate division GAL15 bacterium]
MPKPVRVLILGASGPDFHNFNVYFRHRPDYRGVALHRHPDPPPDGAPLPTGAGGPPVPRGIPIVPEEELEAWIQREVLLSYSDVSHEHVMHVASRALAAGTSARLLGPQDTLLRVRGPVLAVGAVRTGSSKSQTTRKL